MGLNRKRGQIYFIDFLLGVMIFAFAIFMFFKYHPLVAQEQDLITENLMDEVKIISEFFMSEGAPNDWTNETVELPGFLNYNNEIDPGKIELFQNESYERQKELLRTNYDFYMMFFNENDTVMVINGKCGVGEIFIDVKEEIKVAYVYHDASGNEIGDEMEEIEDELNITVDHFQLKGGFDMDDYVNDNMSDYQITVFEHPKIKDAEIPNLEQFMVDNEKFIFFSGDLAQGGDKEDIFDIDYDDRGGKPKEIRITGRDPMLSFALGDVIDPKYGDTVEDADATLDVIGRYYVKQGQNMIEEKPAIAKWDFGQSHIYYFSHFKADFLGDEEAYQEKVKDLIMQYLDVCIVPINMQIVDADNVVRVNRYLRYNNQLVKMSIFMWN